LIVTAWWLKQIAAANLGWIDLDVAASSSKLRLKSEADIDRPVPRIAPQAGLLVSNAVAVVLNIWYVVEAPSTRQNKEW